jgi:hypothetical protein
VTDDVHADRGPALDPEPVPNPGGAWRPGTFDPLLRRVEPWLPTRAARTWFALFLLVCVVHLAAHLVVGAGDVARVTQWVLMPLLAAALWCATPVPRPRLVLLVVVALLCSWAGDTVPGFVAQDAAFVVMMALFLCAQVVYVVAFAPHRAHSVLRRRRGAVVGYVVVYAAVVAAVAIGMLPQGGAAVPIVVGVMLYGAVLVAMASLATGVHPLAGAGGALFLVSDGLIGVAQAIPETVAALAPGVHGFLVMLTYLAAQALLAAGVRRRSVGGRG